MSVEASSTSSAEISTDLYFLIQKFLSVSSLQKTYKVFVEELHDSNVLPKRIDWEGNEHSRSLEEWEKHYPHIGPDYLLKICSRLGPMLEAEFPSVVHNPNSLLGAGRQSLLRKSRWTLDTTFLRYAARRHGMPLANPHFLKTHHNIVNVLIGREYSGPVTRNLAISAYRYSTIQLQRRTLGHLSAVYCLLFDHTGKFIVTGADDFLIKVWSATSGRLLSTFRGASSEISDIAINLENTLLAAGSLDRILRVWDLQTAAPVAILIGHTAVITSVNFCPSSRWDIRYLISTSTDGSVAFWTYSHGCNGKAEFLSKPIQYQERMRPGQAQMICSSFSPGGSFLATGSADHHVRVYLMSGDEGPHRVLETQAHTDRVDSIQWSNRSLRFVSGSKDGTAHVWNFETQQWRSMQLNMRVTASDEEKKLKVTMVAWDCSDTYIVTAVSDFTLKVWQSHSGKLDRSLSGHTDEIYVLEAHPHDVNVVFSAGHDGIIFIWDILSGTPVAKFMNNIEGQGFGAVFDAKWSPDGTMIAATDSHGHILMFGFGNGNTMLETLPTDLFFHTDYRPVVRDASNAVLDEQTQVAPHLMPPPFLVDVDGNPYPPMLQRLVPGREHCQTEQLIPNIVVGNEGLQEVIEGIPDGPVRFEALAFAQRDNEEEPMVNGGEPSLQQQRANRTPGVRRIGEIDVSTNGCVKWSKRILVKALKPSELNKARAKVEFLESQEIAQYRKEMRRRPLMINTASTAPPAKANHKMNSQRRDGRLTRYRRQSDHMEPETEGSTSGSDSSDSGNPVMDLSSNSSSDVSESSGYSDWGVDHGVNLEPPKRSKRRQTTTTKSILSPDEDEDDQPLAKTIMNKSEHSPSQPKKTVTKVHTPKVIVKGELPEIYKPPEWLSETVPRKAPYFPQMGDEVVYFRQGHQMYVEAVRGKRVYDVNPKDLPWSKTRLRDHEFVKVVGIKYEIRPPRLCCLKLALLDDSGRLTGNIFTIKYHDMADVLDFLVLRQTYDAAMSRNWCPDDKFRCMIDDSWWSGKVVSKSAYSVEFAESSFLSYEVQWDGGEFERMSPWDLEPLREDRVPSEMGASLQVLPEEIESILYHPSAEEWPRGDRESACRRISEGMEQVMALAIAEPFLVPVDLSQYPTYALIVEYPVDLSTIKARLENRFYRRITAVQFDVRYMATNAEKFNVPHSIIVKHARIITELCLKIIKGCSDSLDVGAIYHQLMDNYQSSESEGEVQPGPSTSRSLPLMTSRLRSPDDWKQQALGLLKAIWRCEDSAPFRQPVDHLKHSDYYQVIDTPMDLGAVKEDLLGGNYENPLDFCKDMRLIFQNSKNYNTNKRSKIYAMTIRLSAMFEEHMGRILYNWKMAKRRENAAKKTLKRSRRKVAQQPSTSTKFESSDSLEEDGDDGDDAEEEEPVQGPSTRKMTNAQTNGHAPSEDESGKSTKRSSSSEHSAYEPAAEKRTKPQRTRRRPPQSDVRKTPQERQPRRPPRKGASSSSSASSSEHSAYEPSNCRSENAKKKKQSASPRQRKSARRLHMDVESESGSSDDKPLVTLKSAKRHRASRHSSGSEGVVRVSSRRRNTKRPRYVEDSDDTDGGDSEAANNDSDASDSNLVTVSSRGRIRKLTERARALLRR